MDLKLNNENDLDLTSSALVFVESNAHLIGQRVSIAVSYRTEEWFRDIRLGLPFYNTLYLYKGREAEVNLFITNYIRVIEGVKSVEVVDFTINSRNATLRISIVTKDNVPVNIEV